MPSRSFFPWMLFLQCTFSEAESVASGSGITGVPRQRVQPGVEMVAKHPGLPSLWLQRNVIYALLCIRVQEPATFPG